MPRTGPLLGYVGLCAPISSAMRPGSCPKDVPEAVTQMGIYTADRALMKARAQAGYDTLLKNPMVDATKVALVGYCFGGMVGVDFGSTGAPLVANILPFTARRSAIRPDGAQNAKGKFLILHGAEDVPYPLEKVAEVYRNSAKPRSNSRWSSTAAPATNFPCREQGRGAAQRIVDRTAPL